MKKFFFLVLGITVLAACKQQKPDLESVSLEQENTTAAKGSLIFVTQKSHPFSTPDKEDTFRLVLTGDSVLTGEARLEIIKHDGSILYQDTFASNYLIDYGITDNPTEQEMEAYILKRAQNFFSKKNFMQPALPADRTFDPNYADKAIWEAVQSDSTIIGFHYKLGKEDGKYLAYSKEKGKVLLYLNCC